MIWVILLTIALLAGIILLNSGMFHPQTREQFLHSLAKFLEGTLRPLAGQPDGFAIDFTFEGRRFIYEDLLDRGFQGDQRKGYLKTRVHDDFTIYFTEKPRSTTIKTSVIIASQIPNEPMRTDATVVVPAALKGLDVQTNNNRLANKLLADHKVVEVLRGFYNVDSRGFPSMAWKILEGTMILEFHPAQGREPNYQTLAARISCAENYLEDLLKVVRFFK